jgi:hypothetical protein
MMKTGFVNLDFITPHKPCHAQKTVNQYLRANMGQQD